MQEEKAPAQVSPKTHHTHQLVSLFQHTPFPHKPRNVNEQHKAEQEASGVNTRIAVGLTGDLLAVFQLLLHRLLGLLVRHRLSQPALLPATARRLP